MAISPFATTAAAAYKAAWHVKNPAVETEASIQRMLARGNYTLAEAKEVIAANPLNIEAQNTYNIWISETPCYLAKDVHAKLLVVTPFAQWRYQNGVPLQLAAWQAAFLLKTLRPRYTPLAVHKDLDSLFGEPPAISPHAPDAPDDANPHVRIAKHPKGFTVTDGSPERQRTKVGRVYGGWRVVEPLSEGENTAHNTKVMYRCACTSCGDVRDISYHSIGNTVCRTCKSKRFRATKLSTPVILYINASGQLYKPATFNDIPEDAVGFVKITENATWTDLTPAVGKVLKADMLLRPLESAEIPIAERLHEEEAPTPVVETPHDPHDIPLPSVDDFVELDELPEMVWEKETPEELAARKEQERKDYAELVKELGIHRRKGT